jgi:hypothetical protein
MNYCCPLARAHDHAARGLEHGSAVVERGSGPLSGRDLRPGVAVHAEKDKEIFVRADVEPTRAAIASEDRTCVTIEGAGHYFEPPFGERDAPHVEALMDVVVPWIEARFG